ncbi:MAG: phosphomannomutase/phosphoglucomutase [Pseudohongiellaceae bacterium]|jgi:phosphomannomutase/phosphoglucomutase
MSETIEHPSQTSLEFSNYPETNPASTIFRAYDVRGITDTQLTPAVIFLVAKAIASDALEQGIDTLYFGFDGRNSSPALSQATIDGILSTGCNVIDLGLVPSPVVYFATHALAHTSGVMLTASHNPANYNGLKILFRRISLTSQQIQNLRLRIQEKRLLSGTGSYHAIFVNQQYIADICSKITLKKPMRIVIDCGNAVPGVIAPELFEKLGCDVVPLFCDVDGNFPNHHPDPTVAKNLEQLCAEVLKQKADLGIAFDGDGDRVAIVTNDGEVVGTDRLLMLLIKAIAPKYPGEAIVFDVKCSRAVAQLITQLGAIPVMHRSGHSFMKQKMAETGAPLGGEFASHIFIKDRWYGFDDGLYAAARTIEILSELDHSSGIEFATLQTPLNTPEIAVQVSDEIKFELMAKVRSLAVFPQAKICHIDGLRIEFDFGWGLIRASNTSPALLLRFEADTLVQIDYLKNQFKALIHAADKNIQLGF